MKTFKTILIKKEQIADKSWAYYFKKPKNFTFTAGQYCKITIFNPAIPDIKGNTKSFSFASTPSQEELEIVIRLRDSAYKKSLHALAIGGEIEMLAPLTMMSLKGHNTRPLVFLCGGIGVSAARSIILDALEKGFSQNIYLFNSNRFPERTVFLKEFQDLPKQYSNFHYIPTITGKDDTWVGEKGYLDQLMIEKYIINSPKAIFYVAGTSKFVWSMYKVLQKMGVKDSNIQFDEFTGY